MMIICGPEEPLGPNDMLIVWEELGYKDFPHDPAFERLNRYSFVSLSDQLGWEPLQPLIHTLITMLPGDRTWVSTWEHHATGDERIRSLAKLSIYRKAGWEMQQEPMMVFARKRAVWDDPSGHPWNFVHPTYNHACLVVGACPPLSILVESPFERSLRNMAISGGIVLDGPTADWLADHHLSVISPRKDDVGRTGLVVVTPHCIPFHQLHAQGVIDLLEVENPSYVWRRSPFQP